MSWTKRYRSNSNDRGSAEQRRKRKQWLLDTFGDGVTAPCSFEGCETMVDFDTIQVDRHPIPGVDGGTYARGNIRPACFPHNYEHGLKLAAESRARNREAKKLAAQKETP